MKYILLIFLIFPTIVFAQNYMENFELSLAPKTLLAAMQVFTTLMTILPVTWI